VPSPARLHAFGDLARVLVCVEVSQRSCDQAVGRERPGLPSVEADPVARPAKACVGAFVGPQVDGLIACAAAIYLAWSHHGRIRNEAAFAALAGVAPIPASSGQTTRHRLNRGGDRQLNRALHTITLSRLACHPETRAYASRRQAEGKTPREIRRCLKRHLARRIYKLLENTP
jgi:hypothetical protein